MDNDKSHTTGKRSGTVAAGRGLLDRYDEFNKWFTYQSDRSDQAIKQFNLIRDMADYIRLRRLEDIEEEHNAA